MADRERLLELAERVEAATGPDRELDEAVIDAFGWRNDFGTPIPPGFVGVPLYTSSIGHAMTLVPRGWQVELSRSFDDDGEYFSLVKLTDSFSVGRGCDPEDEASVTVRKGAAKAFQDPTALALTAAALRALASMENGHG